MKGLHFCVGSFSPVTLGDEGLSKVNEGILYITNQRALFQGVSGSTAIPHTRITAFSVARDGVIIEQDMGKHPHFLIHGDVELAGLVLGAALATV